MGCDGKPERLELPAYEPTAGHVAIAAYDNNKDGQISGDEFLKCPALQSTLARLDSNKDGAVSAEEIDIRIQQWRASRAALMPVCCKVLIDGKPIAKARITFEPEAFLGNLVRSASVVTNEEGVAILSISPDYLPNPRMTGVAPGFYRIVAEVDRDGRVERYTTGPHTGCEVASDAPWSGEGIVTAEFTTR
jgi:hypothetical protein